MSADDFYINKEKMNRYIHSNEYLTLKNKRLEIDNHCCVICKSNQKLILHHLTYVRLFHEDINDLIILCDICHKRMHRLCPPIDTPDFCQRGMNGINEPSIQHLAKELEKIKF